jgi:hypothetical protein
LLQSPPPRILVLIFIGTSFLVVIAFAAAHPWCTAVGRQDRRPELSCPVAREVLCA